MNIGETVKECKDHRLERPGMTRGSEAMRSSTFAPSETRFVMYSGPRASRAARHHPVRRGADVPRVGAFVR